MSHTLAKRATAFVVAACMTAQPAIAAITDISNVPLASAAGTNFLPNLLFTLDDSGSMDRNYLPDYVNDTNTCMVSDDGTACQAGDPPFAAGGQTGMNGVAYDPNFTYLVGLSSNGQPVLNPPTGTLTPTSVSPDAYLGGSNVNLTTNSPDNRYCNGTGGSAVCKRNGADNTGVVTPVGIEVQSFTQANVLGPGQFPYRTNPSSASLTTFGLPEMMSIGTFSRAGNVVTVDTVEPHGLVAATDRIFVTGTGQAGMDLAFVAIATVPNANRFTYTSTSSGTITARAGSYRRYGPGSFQRSGNTVTVTATSNHLVVTGDIATFVVPTQTSMNATNVAITVTSATTFTYTVGGSATIPATAGYGVRTGLYNVRTPITGAPAVYRITPIEYCTDAALTDCMLVIPPATPPASHPYAATVRFCRTRGEALAPGLVTGTSILAPATSPTPRCQLKYVNVTGLQTYIFPRFSWFTRDTVTSGVATYGNRPSRSDCVGAPTCTYAEEMQNYSRWFTYYSNRMRMMKTSAGRAFLSFISNPTGTPPRPDRIRVGFITINPTTPNTTSGNAGSSVLSCKYLKIDNFNTTHAGNWYTKFYSIVPNPSTPLREALSRAGWIFAGKLNTGLTNGIPTADDPIQASCQKNYSIFTTDGFWNQGTGQDIAGNTLLNHDNVDNQVIAPYTDKMVSRASGTYDGNILNGTTAGTSPGGRGTLADVALYYYKTDLRGGTDSLGNPTGPATSPSTTPPGGDVSTNNVLPGPKDFVEHQHMVTFTLGLADGLMRYQADYESALTGDFANIKNGATGCFWATGICNWPAPQADGQSALDDLWHAAVNGRGNFYSALNPNALATGLTDALNKLDISFASAAAAATSSPNVASGAEFAFSTRYQTANWSGEVYAQKIDPLTGDVGTRETVGSARVAALESRAERRYPQPLDVRLGDGDEAQALQLPLDDSGGKGVLQQQVHSPEHDDPVHDADALPAHRRERRRQGGAFPARPDRPGDDRVPRPRGDRRRQQRDSDRHGRHHQRPAAVRAGQAVLRVFRPRLHDLQERDSDRPERNPVHRGQRRLPARLRRGHRGRELGLHAQVRDAGGLSDCRLGLRRETPVFPRRHAGVPGCVRRLFEHLENRPGGRGERRRARLLRRGHHRSPEPEGAVGILLRPDIVRHQRPRPRTGLRQPGHRQAQARRQVGGGRRLGAQQREHGRRQGLLLCARRDHRPDPSQGEHRLGLHDDSLRPCESRRLVRQGTRRCAVRLDIRRRSERRYLAHGHEPGHAGLQSARAQRAAHDDACPHALRHAEGRVHAGRLQPITARPVATPLTVTGLGRKRIVYFATGRYLGNSDLADAGAGGPAWQQSIYGLMDKDTGVSLGDVRASGTLVQQTLSPLGPGKRAVTKNAVDWSARNGFYIDLLPNIDAIPTDGERIVLDLQLVLGTLVVTSTIPEKGGCTPGGFSYQYNLDFKTGGYVGNSAPAVGSGSKSELIVGTAIVQTSDGSIKAINKSYTGENTPANVGIDPFTR